MKRSSLKAAELLDGFAFLLWLYGSSLALIRHGIELSLWLMALAVLSSFAIRVLPWVGIRWLRLEKKGCQGGRWLAIFLQVLSWGTFAYTMFLRLGRNMESFYTFIILTTLLWASWLLTFIYSRYACHPQKRDDTLKGKM